MIMEKRIRVLLADDHAVVRAALARVLDVEPDIEVVGVRLVEQVRPDVVVMDVGMGPVSGTEATRCIMAVRPGVRVVALSMYDAGWMSSAMLQAGARAYVEKGAPYERLVAAIRGTSDAQVVAADP